MYAESKFQSVPDASSRDVDTELPIDITANTET